MSNIIYAPKSWNPISGCSPISEGCANCWAKVMARRQRQEWGIVHLHPERLDQPLHWRKPQTVAVAFMGDWCHPDVPDKFIDKVFAVMALTPQHTYLLLTKRPERMRAYLAEPTRVARVDLTTAALVEGKPVRDIEGFVRSVADDATYNPVWPLPNVWLGVSCENQARADERIPLLLDTPAAHRWVSLEPLLGAISLRQWLDIVPAGMPRVFPLAHTAGVSIPSLDWVVIGGESGPHARPCDLGWIRDVRDQCKAAGVPCYVKQMGSVWAKGDPYDGPPDRRPGQWPDSKGEDWRFWEDDLRVREMPEGSE